MVLSRRLIFVNGVMSWLLVVIAVLAAAGTFTLELFLLFSLMGLLLLAEYTAPVNVTPLWRRRLRLVTVTGMFVFAMIVLQWIVSNLPEEAPL